MLDIDGTLCDIVERANEVSLPTRAGDALRSLSAGSARGVHVAFVTGRSVTDARRLLGIPGAVIYGNHGMERLSDSGDIRAPEGWQREGARMREAKQDLEGFMAAFPGSSLEDKQFTLTLHFRRMNMEQVPEFETRVADIATRHALRLVPGKCVINVLPAVGFNKGDAVLEILHEVEGRSANASILFAGDDVTDEDGFQALRQFPGAVTLRVGNADATSAAHFSLAGPHEMNDVLALLAESRQCP
jgi:trehalose-phosphatase